MTTTTEQEVPQAYRGVWVRTLLETPTLRDTSTFVRWLQTPQWHADLRVPLALQGPVAARAATLAQRAGIQGFCGITRVTPGSAVALPVCEWHRRVDFQPPGLSPDAGTMVFDTPHRVIERGIHADYLEVWERLPGTEGPFEVRHGAAVGSCLLRAGCYAMRVRARSMPWPSDTTPGDSLAQVLQRHPTAAEALMDFEISCGPLQDGAWHIEQSTRPELMGQQLRWEAELARCP